MSTQTPRITGPTLKVLGQLMTAPLSGLSGAEISKATSISSGTLYPILIRLEKAGWLSSEWEEVNPCEVGRPRKRFYQLTSVGAQESRAVFDDLFPTGGQLVWQS